MGCGFYVQDSLSLQIYEIFRNSLLCHKKLFFDISHKIQLIKALKKKTQFNTVALKKDRVLDNPLFIHDTEFVNK